jgi:hypothetical protein
MFSILARHFFLVMVGLLSLSFSLSSASAQEGSRWSFANQIPDYDKNGRAPFLIADRNRLVHAFNVQSVGEGESSIFYRQWALDLGWTFPVDIILPPRVGSLSVEGVHLDEDGIFHLIFFVGDNVSGGIYYSKAFASAAGRAQSWSLPVLIGEHAGPVGSATLIGKENGELIVVYAGKKEGVGLYQVMSPDGGETWSSPGIAALVFEVDLIPSGIGMVIDKQERLHLVWSQVNIRGLGEGIYYSSFQPEIADWGPAVTLALLEESDYSTNWPSIVFHRDQLMIIYQDSRPATRWMRMSSDAGLT